MNNQCLYYNGAVKYSKYQNPREADFAPTFAGNALKR